MSKKTEEAMQLVGVASNEISSILDYFFSQVPVSERAALERLIERVAMLPGFVGLKSGIDPEPIMRCAIANLHVTDQAVTSPGEAAPRIPIPVARLTKTELDQSSEPAQELIRQMALAGVPGSQTAMILMTLAAKLLLQDAGANHRAVALLISAFAAQVDKGQIDPQYVM